MVLGAPLFPVGAAPSWLFSWAWKETRLWSQIQEVAAAVLPWRHPIVPHRRDERRREGDVAPPDMQLELKEPEFHLTRTSRTATSSGTDRRSGSMALPRLAPSHGVSPGRCGEMRGREAACEGLVWWVGEGEWRGGARAGSGAGSGEGGGESPRRVLARQPINKRASVGPAASNTERSQLLVHSFTRVCECV